MALPFPECQEVPWLIWSVCCVCIWLLAFVHFWRKNVICLISLHILSTNLMMKGASWCFQQFLNTSLSPKFSTTQFNKTGDNIIPDVSMSKGFCFLTSAACPRLNSKSGPRSNWKRLYHLIQVNPFAFLIREFESNLDSQNYIFYEKNINFFSF